jgi:hypothetical protein
LGRAYIHGSINGRTSCGSGLLAQFNVSFYKRSLCARRLSSLRYGRALYGHHGPKQLDLLPTLPFQVLGVASWILIHRHFGVSTNRICRYSETALVYYNIAMQSSLEWTRIFQDHGDDRRQSTLRGPISTS